MNILITENQLKFLIENIINEQVQSKEETEAEKLIKQTEKEFFKQMEMEDELIKMMYKMPKIDMDTYIKWVDYDSLDDKIVYNKRNKDLYVHGYNLFNYFKTKYNLEYNEITQFFKDALSKHYDLEIDEVLI